MLFPNLEAEMARNKITRAELAKKIHKTPTTISLKLNGKTPITLAECVEIKEAINTNESLDYLFKTDD